MTALAKESPTRAIVVEEIVPHTPETVWRVLTTPELVNRWMMKNNFTPGLGQKFTMHARPMGDWDGTVACEITAFDPPTLLGYTWVGGSVANASHGSALDSTVTWTLTPVSGGTKVRMVHDGFRSPQNDAGFDAMSGGWNTIVQRISAIASELA
jgi:uncharacterized protein YndB with AHSA1/START domain